MSETLHRVLDRALQLPGILQWRRQRFDRAFAGGDYGGACRGVYASFDEAAEAAPRSLPLGYDNDGPAGMYRDRLERVYPSDYPMIHWLTKRLAEGVRRILDLGGHVGIGYYAYQRYIDYPPDLRWQVLDVPAVASAGRHLAETRDQRHALEFVDSFDAAADSDLLFSSGCLQYLQQPLAAQLAGLQRRPPWLLLNLLPLHPALDYWTIQSIGRAFCPYHIQRIDAFFEALRQVGYQKVDVWGNAEKECHVAFEPDHDVVGYHGALLRLSS